MSRGNIICKKILSVIKWNNIFKHLLYVRSNIFIEKYVHICYTEKTVESGSQHLLRTAF